MPRLKTYLKGFSNKRFFKISAVVLFLAAVLLTVLFIKFADKGPELNSEYDGIIKEYAEKYSLDASLLYAVIESESDFDEKAVSSAGALGLMQIMPETFEWISRQYGDTPGDIFNPRQNIEAGCRYLVYLYKRFGETSTVLAAYNAGEGTVLRWLKTPEYSENGRTLVNIPYPETKSYVNKVLRSMEMYKKANWS
jgi:soluble lytic murein transglycosylase